MSDPIQVDVSQGVATVVLNNPPLNIVTLPMTAMLEDVLDRLATDPDVHVLVLTGAGDRGFCAGSDIKEFPEMQAAGNILQKKLIRENRVYSKVDDFPKPTIAAVKGLAMGGGLELAVCCDLIVVDEDVRLSLPEIKLGWFPGSGGTVRVTRRIGEGRAKEMMFIGEPIGAETALAWGLVNRVVPKTDVVDEAIEIAREIASRSNPALRCCKAAIDLSFDGTEDEAIEGALELSEQVFRTQDSREGVRAFLAKDTPRFNHS